MKEPESVSGKPDKTKPVTVHVLNYWGISHSHVEIVLEQSGEGDTKYYYLINHWEFPASRATLNNKDLISRIKDASESHKLEIKGDINALAEQWKEEQRKQPDCFICCFNNCADTTAWFLEKFVNIKKPTPCSSPVTCNYLFCGFFVPSFVPTGCTLPGRVFDNAKASSDNTTQEISYLVGGKETKEIAERFLSVSPGITGAVMGRTRI